MRLRWLRSGHLFMIGALGLAGCSGPAAPTPAISTVPAGQPAASDPPSVACTFAIPEEHLSRDVGPAGGAFTVPITTQPSCTWTVTTAAPFVVVDPSSGTGSGGVLVTVASNSGDSRVTPLTVAGEVVTIRQGAASAPSPGCTSLSRPESWRFRHPAERSVLRWVVPANHASGQPRHQMRFWRSCRLRRRLATGRSTSGSPPIPAGYARGRSRWREGW